MRARAGRRVLRRIGGGIAWAVVCQVLAAAPCAAGAAPNLAPEVRALWVTPASLTNPAAVSALVTSAQGGHFNTLLVQVRSRGDAYFNDGFEPRASALAGQPETFDPLDLTLRLAHAKGIRVHAWVNIALVWSASELPSSKLHFVHRHPEWLMVPRELARDMVLLDPHSQLYLDKLMRWTRTQSAEVEGLYASPIPPGAADAAVSVVADLVARYPLDGVHLDYVRYPNDNFDFSREALEAFKAEVLAGSDPAERRRLERAMGADLLGWTQAYPDRWRAFRCERLTALLTKIRDSVKARRPGAVCSAAVIPDATEASRRWLQDWGTWLERHLLDVVCPTAYTADAAAFSAQVARVRQVAGSHPVWAGIGAYRLSPSQTIESIQIARRLGATGIVLFSYDSLISLPGGQEHLAQLAHAAFAQ